MAKKITLQQIPPDNELLIHVKVNKNEMDIKTKSAFAKNGDLYVPTIKVQGKAVGFNKDKCELSLYVQSEPLPYVFSDVDIHLTALKGKKYHKISTEKSGIELNRRKNYRLYVGANAHVQLGGTLYDATLKDVSLTGFSFLLNEEATFASSFVSVQFEDLSRQLVLLGDVVRTYRTENGKYLYGCKLRNEPKGFENYISEKQREEVQKRNR